MQYLYQHVTEISSFEKVVAGNETLKKDEKLYLIKVARSSVHTKTISFCLENFQEDQHKHDFLARIKEQSHSVHAHNLAKSTIPEYEKQLENLIIKVESELIDMLID